MYTLFRAGLVGAIVGLEAGLLFTDGPEDSFFGTIAILLVPFSLGVLLCWLAMLPFWGVVAGATPLALIAVGTLCLPGLTYAEVMSYGTVPVTLVFAAIGVSGYVAMTALIMPGHWAIRSMTVGAVVVAYLAVGALQGEIGQAARAQVIERSGVPLVAPTLKDHELGWVDDEELPAALGLVYFRTRDGSSVDVSIRPGNAATPETACVKPPSTWMPVMEPNARCRRVATDVWVRTDETYTTVVARHGAALVQVTSEEMTEAELLAVLPTFHVVEAERLLAEATEGS
ncbi:hypothetical protein ACFXJ8_07180 [Nonomuraea sp. NPDC059194]|uniref:hypothetical protein n=1 Tax=Nonomuraea sp. NPDC059194 TaxID=3346764 RepID=UPI003674C3FF